MPRQSYQDQLNTIGARQTFDQRLSFASQSATPQLAQATVAHSQAYPWMAPQSAYALAANGNQPGDSLSQAVATASLNKKGGGFWHSLGHVVTAPMRAAVHLTEAGLHEVGVVAKPLARTVLTAAETPLQVGVGVLRDVASATGDIGAGIASGAATGAAVGLAGGPLAPISVLAGTVGGAVVGGVLGGVAQARGVKVEGGMVNPLAQSTGGLAAGALLTGNKVDLGSGFLPGGAIHEQQIKNAQAAASINGHALTPGRFLASSLVRPGSTPYNLLSGVTDAVTTWNLDPSRYIGEEIGAQRAAAKVIPGVEAEAGPLTQLGRNASKLTRDAGILQAADPAVHADLAREFLTTDGAAQRFIARAAETDSAAEIRAASKGKIPATIANQLKAATTPQDVLDILLQGVEGGTLKERAAVQSGRDIFSTLTNTRPAARLASTMERLGGYLPEHTVDLVDLGKPNSTKLDNAVDQMDRYLTQARYPTAERNAVLDRLMAATSPEEASRVFHDTINGDLRERLRALGHGEDTIDRYLKGLKVDATALEDQVHNELATATTPRSIHTGTENIPLDPGNQIREWLKYTVHLPDPSEVRQLTTPKNTRIGESLAGLYNSDGWKSSIHAGDFFMQKFKQGVVVRPALAVRTMAMQHAKMAANGLDTRFSDLGNLFRMVTNPEYRTAFEEGLVEGSPLAKAEGYLKSMRKINGGFTPEELAAHQITVGPGHDLFPQAWASRIAEQHADPVARSIAGEGFEATADAFWDGNLAAERHQLAVDLNKPELLSDRNAADAYVKDVVGSHLSALTADNPHVMEAIATGHIPDPNAPFEIVPSADRIRPSGVAREDVRVHWPDDPEDDASFAVTHDQNHGSFLHLEKDAGGNFRVAESHVAEGARGQGLGSYMYLRAAEEAASRGGVLVSDVGDVSDAAAATWKSLERQGFPVKVIDEATRHYELDMRAASRPGIPLLAEHGDGLVNPDAVKHLEGMALDDTIKVPLEVPAGKDTKLIDPDYGHKVSRMTNWFYSKLVGQPLDFFYNSPALNQLYWKEVASQAHLLDSEGIAQLGERLAQNSAKVNIPADARAALEKAVARGGTGKVSSLEHLDELAKPRAVDALQAMTIDMAKKRGWQDAARLMVPFGKHWEQEMTQWARMAADHPDAYRKAQMTVDGAIGSGFFHKNDQGEYVFNYPGSELVSKIVTGVPTPMTAKASGLSAFTTGILPGFGPLVSIPASKLIPNKPEYDEIRNFFSPFGDPTQKGVLSAVEPPWFKTLQTALADPENDRDAANTTMQVARYLVSTGQFSTDTPEAQDKLLKEAGSRAKKLLTLQALGKFVLPSSPSLEAVARAKGTFAPDGRTVTAKLLADDLQKMRQEDYEHSSENFLTKYGDSALLFLQASTRPIVPGAASTTEQSDFLRSNPDIAKALPNSAAFFAPQGGQTFDPASIARQIHMGERQALTPKQQVALANDQVGSMIYYQLKGALGTRISTAQQAALSVIKQQLMAAYPGFNVVTPGLAARVTDNAQNIQKVLIPELQKSLTIDRTKNSQTGRALDQYLQLRDAVDAVAQKRGLKPGSFASSTSAIDLRAFLRKAADQLGQDNVGFGMLFDRILDRELRTDTEVQAA